MEEKRGSERLTIASRRPLTQRATEYFSSTNPRNQRSSTFAIIDDVSHRQSTTRMKNSSSSHYNSNPSLIDDLQQKTNGELDDESTYSFRRELSKLRTAKSHGELYQPTAPLSLPILTKLSMNSTDEPTPTPSVAPQVVPQASASQKIPIWKRFKKIITPTKKNKDQTNSNSSMKIPPLILSETTNGDEILQNPLKISELRTWLTTKNFPEQRIRDEYEKLPTESLHPKSVAFRPENRPKNRFNAIEPYDHSRVVLRRLANDPSSDYINASYIDGYQTSKVYIAAQAPTETTLNDFLRMIFQLKIQSIVMVTRLFEDGKNKSAQYWPDEGEKRVQDFRIRLENEEKYADFTIRRLIITNPSESTDVLIVKQFHFLSWPDHGCLSLSTPLLDFRQRFRSEHRSTTPILVHCSAGVGRSGTFIALDALLEAAERHETIDVLEFTHRMRQNRVFMIQTVEQYVFLYRTLIEGILTFDTFISLQEFLTTKKLRVDAKTQFRLLEQLENNVEFSYRGATDPQNTTKNRSEFILAPDTFRPYLMTQVEKTTDYINAVFVNSYRHSPSYIVTQYPLPHTCVDFWRLVYDHNVSIVMLLETIPRDAKNVAYWNPSIGQSAFYGPLEIIMTSQKEDDCLIERVFELKNSTKNLHNGERVRMIRQFQIKDNADRLIIIKRFLKEMRTYNEQNVILQCLNGVTSSGQFAALCNSIDKMQTEQIVDPFKIVRLLRSVRPQFVDQNQYENLFQSMFDYAQRYLMSMRFHENSSSTSVGHDESRVIQRL